MNSAVSSLPLEDCGLEKADMGSSPSENLLPKLFPKIQGKGAALSWCGFSKVSFLPGTVWILLSTFHQTLPHHLCCGARNVWLTEGATLVLMELALEGKAGGSRG